MRSEWETPAKQAHVTTVTQGWGCFVLVSCQTYCSTPLIFINCPSPGSALGFPLYRLIAGTFLLSAQAICGSRREGHEDEKPESFHHHGRNYQEVNSECLLFWLNYRPVNTSLSRVRVQGQTVILIHRGVQGRQPCREAFVS